MQNSDFHALMASAKRSADLTLCEERLVIYPAFNIVTKRSHMAVAFTCFVREAGHGHVVVVAYGPGGGSSEPEFLISCGDKFLEARVDMWDAQARCNDAGRVIPAASCMEDEVGFDQRLSRLNSVVSETVQKRAAGFTPAQLGAHLQEAQRELQQLLCSETPPLPVSAPTLAQSPASAAVLSGLMMSNFGSSPVSHASCDFWVKWRRDRMVCSHVSHVLATLRDNRPDFQDEIKRRYDEVVAFAVA